MRRKIDTRPTTTLVQILARALVVATATAAVVGSPTAGADQADREFIVYSIEHRLNMGEPGEKTLRDYYLTIGSSQGVQVGNSVEIIRRVPTYDVLSEKLYRDMLIPVARLKVIHSEKNASIARLEKMLSPDQAPVLHPQAVAVGDLVKKAQ